MDSYYKYIRYLAYTIEILVFYVIEGIPNIFPDIKGVRPILLILVAIMISLFEGKKVGTVFGLIVGLFLDYGASGDIGFYSVVITCVSFLVGVIAQKMIKFNLITSILIAISFTTIVYMAHFMVKYLLCGYSDIIYSMLNHYLIGILYTSLFSPFIYFFNKAFAVNIQEKE